MALIQDPNNPRFLYQNAGLATPTRELSAGAGDVGSALSLTRTQSSAVADSTPATKFSMALMELMKRYQSMGTSNMAQQGFNAQSQQNQAVLAQTPQSLIGASPGIQSGVRNAQASVFDPTIQGAAQSGQTFKEQLGGFKTALDSAREFTKAAEESENKIRDDARAVINQILTSTDPESIRDLEESELERIEKLSGYPKGFLKNAVTYKKKQLILAETKERRLNGSGTTTGPEDQLYAGLSGPTSTAVRAQVSKYSTQPLVTNFATIQDGYNFAKNLSSTTKNPSDDQALIYQFAKIMDPGSVVREGEYATVQKYAQSWKDAFGKSITQAINGTGFLSQTARENIKSTIESRYKASKASYDSLKSSTVSAINNLTGRQNGSEFLIDYVNPGVSGPKTIRVRLNSSGKTGTIPENEFDPKIYTKI